MIDTAATPSSLSDSPSAPSAEALIRMHQVNKYYGDFQALANISMQINRGERVVICGPSGSGKSTLIRCINHLESHNSGEITVAGVPVTSRRRDLAQVRDKVGMVFQQFNLFPHLTVMQNLTLGPMRSLGKSKQQAQKTAQHYLERVRIPEQADKYPRELSGGQQQRVAIARSLCMSPEIMLFDEPTSALDPEMISEVLDVMTELAMSGMTMICVTHEMGFARKVADSMIFMDKGEIVEMSATHDFFHSPQSQRSQRFLEKILNH